MAPPAGRSSRQPARAVAIDEGHVREVVPAEIQEIKGVECHPVRPPGLKNLLQFGEAGDAGLLLDHHFPVDQRRAELQCSEGLRDRPEAVRPVQALAGQELHLAAVDPGLQAIAVKLDLVEPARTARGGIGEGSERGLDEYRKNALLGAADTAALGRGAERLVVAFSRAA